MSAIVKSSHKVHYGYKDGQTTITLKNKSVAGKGTFGIVYGAVIDETDTKVAIKKVFQDSRYKNRELQIMKMLQHQNIIDLLYFFKQKDEKNDIYLHVIMDYYPQTVLEFIRQNKVSNSKSSITLKYIKLFTYQMMRGLAYMHWKSIAHRDIKPTNLLINMEKGALKICDFGSAKMLNANQPNVSYICSRYYRAPELILGSVNYNCAVDIWSSGCVLAEMVLCRPIFPGETSMDQMVEIIRVIGSPSRKQISEMNPDYKEYTYPQVGARTLEKVFTMSSESILISLLQSVFEYSPKQRITAIESLVHPFFNDLRDLTYKLPGNFQHRLLYDLTEEEKLISPSLNHLIMNQQRS